jgi:hypothetical protein
MKRLLLILSIVPSISFGQLIISGGATGGGSGDALTSGTLAQFAATTSSQFKGVISDENAPDGASSKVIMALGSLSLASGKTATVSNTLTLAGTDGTTMTFPSTSATIARTDAANTFTGNQTLRAVPRVTSISSNATWSPNADTDDVYEITAQAADATTISNPSGTPTNGQKLMIRVTGTAARALTWSGSQWRASSDLALPTTTTTTKTMYLLFVYNSTGPKWDLVSKLDNF